MTHVGWSHTTIHSLQHPILNSSKKIKGSSENFSMRHLKNLGKKLPENSFMSVHKSFILGTLHIDFMEGKILNIGNIEIPMGSTFKDEIKKKFTSK